MWTSEARTKRTLHSEDAHRFNLAQKMLYESGLCPRIIGGCDLWTDYCEEFCTILHFDSAAPISNPFMVFCRDHAKEEAQSWTVSV